MKKIAEVLKCNDDGTATIALYKHQKCSGCGLCNKDVHPGSIISAENTVHASVGDMVSVEVQKSFSIKPFFVMYLMPTLLFFAGLGLGSFLFPKEQGGWQAMLLAFVLLAIAIAVAFVYQKKHRPAYQAKIVKRA